MNEKIGLYCNEHKLDNMIDVINKKCIFKDCLKISNYNYEDQKYGIYCNEHKLNDMIDIKNKKCLTEHCDIIAQIPKYKGYCLRCFIYNFPNEPVIRNYRLKEKHIEDYLNKEFPNHKFINDKQISGGCSKRRPDFILDCLTHNLIIENDEHQHEYNSCENKRMMEIFLDGGNIPTVFLRINPDAYINENGKKIKSCFKINNKGILVIRDKKEWEHRLNLLKNRIEYHLNHIPEKEITLEKLFFDV